MWKRLRIILCNGEKKKYGWNSRKGSGPIMILPGRVPNNARPDKQLQAFKPETVVSGCVTNGIL